MNYQTLFKESDIVDRNDDFRFMRYPLGGEIQLQPRSRFPMLFVLEGLVELRFKYEACPIEAGNLVVFSASELVGCTTAPGTIVLIYRPPHRLATFIEQSSKAFETLYSSLVPILAPLQEWIDLLIKIDLEGSLEEVYAQRCRLAHILTQNYPHRLLGDLYTPFATCTLGQCELCRAQAVEMNRQK